MNHRSELNIPYYRYDGFVIHAGDQRVASDPRTWVYHRRLGPVESR